jgi:hypothetical protein
MALRALQTPQEMPVPGVRNEPITMKNPDRLADMPTSTFPAHAIHRPQASTRSAVRRSAARLLVLLALMSATSNLVMAPALAQTPAVGDGMEVEFWKSVDRIATPRAYRIYLDKYPNGQFAPLAREAIQRAAGAVPTGAAPPAVTPAPASGAAPAAKSEAAAGQGPTATPAPAVLAAPRVKLPLKYFKDAASSDAITFELGDRFNGPGPVRVGWGKSNKQLPLPSGEWIALAATDHDQHKAKGMAPTVKVGRTKGANAQLGGTIKLTTVALGKFDGNQLASLMLVMLNRTTLPVQMTSPEAEACENGNEAHLFDFKEGPFHQRTCGVAIAVEAPLTDATRVASSELLADLTASIKRMGATVKGPGIVTTLMFTGKADGWMRLQRIDFPAVYPELDSVPVQQWEAASKASPTDKQPSSMYLRQLHGWMDGYVTKASSGWMRNLDESDLEPGTPARTSPPLPDFAPHF